MEKGTNAKLVADLESSASNLDCVTKQLKQSRIDCALANEKFKGLEHQFLTARKDGFDSYKGSEAWKADCSEFLAEHGEDFYMEGWKKCADYACTRYPNINAPDLMEPEARAKLEARVRKAARRGRHVEEVSDGPSSDPDSSEAEADDDDDEDAEDDAAVDDD